MSQICLHLIKWKSNCVTFSIFQVYLLWWDWSVCRHRTRHAVRRQKVHRSALGPCLRQFPRDQPERPKRLRAAVSKLPVRGARSHSALLGSHRRPGGTRPPLGGILRHRLTDFREHPAARDAQRQRDGGVRSHPELGRGGMSQTGPPANYREQTSCFGQGDLLDSDPGDGAGRFREWRGAIRRADAHRDQWYFLVVHGGQEARAEVRVQTAEGLDAAEVPPIPVVRVPQQSVAVSRALRQHPVRGGQARVHRRIRVVRFQLRLGGVPS